MPRIQNDMRALAGIGAKVRIAELEAEIAALRKEFPGTRATRTVAGNDAGEPKPAGRKRRKMSAKARAAISAAQKARWAKQKAGK
jgi:hypothetical protein